VFPQPAPGVEGDFCDHNPRASVNAGPGGLVAGPEGIWVAHFAWISPSFIDPNNAPAIANSFSNGGPVAGFVHREQQGLITDYLGGTSMHVPGGFMITLHQMGGFFVINKGEGYGHLGMKAFARLSDGAVMFAAAGANPGAASIDGTFSDETFTGKGSILGNVLRVTELGDPDNMIVANGAVLTGDGIADGTRVVRQITGMPQKLGTYAVSIASHVVAAETDISGAYKVLDVTNVTEGSVHVGSMLPNGNGGAFITGQITGTGNVGTYLVSGETTASGTMELNTATETHWMAASAGNPGELMKMTSHVYGVGV